MLKFGRIVFIGSLASLLFISCEKDSLIPVLDEQTVVETRGKCTQVKPGPTIKVPITVPMPHTENAPTAVQIFNGVCAALQAAADKEKDAKVKEGLLAAKAAYTLPAAQNDSNFLGQENVVGVAFPYRYTFYDSKGKLVIIVISIQILEEPSTQLTKDHEDGHSFISKEVAKKVAEKAASDAKKMDPKPTPSQLADKVNEKIKEVTDEAQSAYETATASGTKGDQGKEAKKAAKEAIKKYLKS